MQTVQGILAPVRVLWNRKLLDVLDLFFVQVNSTLADSVTERLNHWFA